MNLIKTLFYTAVAGVLVISANKASAVPGIISVSAVISSEIDTNPAAGIYTGYLVQKSINTKDILKLLANATTNSWFTNSNSRLMYDPQIINPEASAWKESTARGIFWVTNTVTHNYFRLDGNDVNTNYFSYVEFDFQGWSDGFADSHWNHNSANKYNQNNNTGKETDNAMGGGTFYVHDNPNAFAYPINFNDALSENDNAFVLTGLVKLNWQSNSTSGTATTTFHLSGGVGDATISGMPGYGPICTGTVSFNGSGPFTE